MIPTTDEGTYRVLTMPADRASIPVHHAGDPLAESALLALPGCPWINFLRGNLGDHIPRFVCKILFPGVFP